MSYHRVSVKKNVKEIIEEEAQKRGCTQSDIVGMAMMSFSKQNNNILLIDKGRGVDGISLYLSPTEKNLLQQLADKSNLSASRYIASLIRIDAGLSPIDNGDILKELNNMTRQIRAVGINLNQQTRAINRKQEQSPEQFKNNLYSENLNQTKEVFNEIKRILKNLKMSLKRF